MDNDTLVAHSYHIQRGDAEVTRTRHRRPIRFRSTRFRIQQYDYYESRKIFGPSLGRNIEQLVKAILLLDMDGLEESAIIRKVFQLTFDESSPVRLDTLEGLVRRCLEDEDGVLFVRERNKWRVTAKFYGEMIQAKRDGCCEPLGYSPKVEIQYRFKYAPRVMYEDWFEKHSLVSEALWKQMSSLRHVPSRGHPKDMQWKPWPRALFHLKYYVPETMKGIWTTWKRLVADAMENGFSIPRSEYLQDWLPHHPNGGVLVQRNRDLHALTAFFVSNWHVWKEGSTRPSLIVARELSAWRALIAKKKLVQIIPEFDDRAQTQVQGLIQVTTYKDLADYHQHDAMTYAPTRKLPCKGRYESVVFTEYDDDLWHPFMDSMTWVDAGSRWCLTTKLPDNAQRLQVLLQLLDFPGFGQFFCINHPECQSPIVPSGLFSCPICTCDLIEHVSPLVFLMRQAYRCGLGVEFGERLFHYIFFKSVCDFL